MGIFKSNLKPYKNKTDSKFYGLMRMVLSPIFKILYRPKYYNKEVLNTNEKLLIISNHRYNLDPTMIVTSTKRVVHFIGKLEIMNAFLIKYVLRHVGIIPVDRTKKAPEVFKVVSEYLKDNQIVALFPEGTRNKKLGEVKLLEFKKGVAKMAYDNQAKIVIAVQKGRFNILSNKGLAILYSEPIELTKDDPVGNIEMLRNKMLDMLDQIENMK